MLNKSTSVNATTIAKVLALSLFLGGSGVGYVYQKDQIQGLVKQRNANELKLYELNRRKDTLKVRLAGITSRTQLELNLRQFKLGLELPEPTRIILLTEPDVARPVRIELVNRP